MSKFNKKTAIVLFNLGGPDKLESVEPFLFNLFNDKAIINLPQPFRFLLAKLISKRRAKKAQKIYENLGGKSPLLELTLSQAYELEKELSFIGNFKVFTSMRYWKPFSKEVVLDILNYQPTNLILLPLYPQFSSSTTKSSIEDFLENFTKINKDNQDINVKIICCYPEEENFIKSHSLLIKQTLLSLEDKKIEDFRLLFSAHGLPQKLIDQGDPYVFQVKKTTDKIIENLSDILPILQDRIDFQICYQSKVGPLQWTSPSLEHEIRRAALDKKIPVIIPVAFVSDHSETLVELDIEYLELAQSLGIKDYLRVPALNIEWHFIKSLFEICKNVSKEKGDIFSADKPIRICPKNFKFCINNNPCKS